MSNQTPPVVSDDQFGKLEQVYRDIVRKGKITGPEFQHVLGHPSFVKEIEANVNTKVAEYRQSLPILERPAFMTVKLGAHKTNKELRKAVIDDGNRISDWGEDILKRIKLEPEVIDIDLVVVTVAELGFPKGATREQIYEKALSIGLALVPQETGAQFRRQYTEQPLNEWILMGMEPVADSFGSLGVFCVVRNGDGRWLRSSFGYADDFWYAGRRWAFRRK